ncbi:MAG: extracellular solute-binding protein family 5 [Thermomicrobiales bacterium]|nr:extracellular solute-binding protein family 5 [Thermomicrobiales bacterium]
MARPVAPHAPHSRRTLLAQGLRGGILLAASPLFLDTAVIPSSRLTRWAIPMDQASTAPLVLATNRAPSDLDPHSAYDPGSQIALGGLFEGLIQIQTGTADTIDPVLAESWTANADKSVWTFFLRPDVTFQDGTPLDAEAARASFERLLTLGLAPSTVLGRFIDDPARITAPDSRTLVFDFGRPQPLFEAAIAAPGVGAVVNAAALRAHEFDGDWGHGWAQTNSDGIGTGPYRVASFEVEEGVILERYPEYWRGWAGEHFDGIAIRVVTEPETRLALIESGEADIVTTLPLATVQDLAANRQLLVDRRFTLAVSYVAMTVAGPLRSAEARQALCWAFPYDDVIDGIYEGFAKRAVGPVAELCRGFNPDTFVYSTDLDRARALLQRAGVAENTTITYALPAGNREANAIPELFATNLAALGLQLDIQVIDFATYIDLSFGALPAEERPNLFSFFWSPDYNDAWNHLWPQVSCAAWQAGNVGQFCNERVEALLEEAKIATDQTRYFAALAEIQQIVTRDDPAAIYVAQAQWPTVLRRDLVGFDLNLFAPEIIDFYHLNRDPTA